jgi:hypothetical protein
MDYCRRMPLLGRLVNDSTLCDSFRDCSEGEASKRGCGGARHLQLRRGRRSLRGASRSVRVFKNHLGASWLGDRCAAGASSCCLRSLAWESYAPLRGCRSAHQVVAPTFGTCASPAATRRRARVSLSHVSQSLTATSGVTQRDLAPSRPQHVLLDDTGRFAHPLLGSGVQAGSSSFRSRSELAPAQRSLR